MFRKMADQLIRNAEIVMKSKVYIDVAYTIRAFSFFLPRIDIGRNRVSMT